MSGNNWYIFRAYKLPELLTREGSSLSNEIRNDMVLWQCITDKIIEYLSVKNSELGVCHNKPKFTRRLDPVEENAIRYAGGYIIRKVITAYKKKGACVDGLLHLVLDEAGKNEEEGSFLQYTCKWLEKTDRGGLYHISEVCFELFSEIELTIYEILNKNFVSKKKTALEDIKQAAYDDDDVKRIWSICSEDMDIDESMCNAIIHSIIHDYIVLHGHSLTSKYMEEFKKLKQEGTRKKKGVRGELKKKDNKK